MGELTLHPIPSQPGPAHQIEGTGDTDSLCTAPRQGLPGLPNLRAWALGSDSNGLGTFPQMSYSSMSPTRSSSPQSPAPHLDDGLAAFPRPASEALLSSQSGGLAPNPPSFPWLYLRKTTPLPPQLGSCSLFILLADWPPSLGSLYPGVAGIVHMVASVIYTTVILCARMVGVSLPWSFQKVTT